uniref:Uncharacterized protein n=1 Tax=Rhizophora mucronata TaxID=61149 RepID=A0A2P2QV47_RHIMU
MSTISESLFIDGFGKELNSKPGVDYMLAENQAH